LRKVLHTKQREEGVQLLMVRLQHNINFLKAEAHYVPSIGDPVGSFVGGRFFRDAHQRFFHSPVDHLRSDLADHALYSWKQKLSFACGQKS
jgi:hypothetical protein